MPGSRARWCHDDVPGSPGRAENDPSRKGCVMRKARLVPLILVRRATLFLAVISALISVGVAIPSPASARSFTQVYNATDTGLCISHSTWQTEQLFEDPCSGPTAISWDVPGDGSFHEWLRGVDEHLCLSAGPGYDGAPVYQEPCGYPNNGSYQQWELINGGQLRNRATGLCLAVYLPQGFRAPLILWDCRNATPDQSWRW